MKIMCVDDSTTMRRIIMNNLKKAGYTDISEAEDGSIALQKLQSGFRPDVILLDWNMPEMSGIDMLRTMKADDNLKDIPVIMVTSEAEKAQVMEAIQAGAAGYLVKPITPEAFKKHVIEKISP